MTLRRILPGVFLALVLTASSVLAGGRYGGGHGGWHGHGYRSHGYYGGPRVYLGWGPFFPSYYPYYGYPYYPYPYYAYPPYPPPPVPPPTAESGAGTGSTGSQQGAVDDQAAPDDDEASRVSYGLVQLRGVPDGAAVDLDGRFWLTAKTLDGRWLALPRGSHRITVRVEQAEPVERQVTVEPGRTATVRFGPFARARS